MEKHLMEFLEMNPGVTYPSFGLFLATYSNPGTLNRPTGWFYDEKNLCFHNRRGETLLVIPLYKLP